MAVNEGAGGWHERIAGLLHALGIALVALGFLGMACGGSAGGDEVTIRLKAENTRFVPDRVEIPAGKTVRLILQNLDAGEHDLEVQGLMVNSMSGGGHGGAHGDSSSSTLALHTQGNKTASVTFKTDQRGTFDIYCTISGHKEVGMVGKLVVISASPADLSPAGPTLPQANPTGSPPVATPIGLPIVPPGPSSEQGHEGH